jgi:hypothetical protein
MYRFIALGLLLLIINTAVANDTGNNEEKTRLIVLTDIENEPDDAQSLVRFLTYTNQWDVKGLIATTSIWQQNEVADWRIYEILEAYEKVRPNLVNHADGYPTYDYLRSIVKTGLPKYGMNGVGPGQDSEGSEWIIRELDKDDPRPLWVIVWGGPNTLAQALWKLKQNKSEEELSRLVNKLRVYTISDQDNSGPWMRKTFPDLFYIASPGYEHNGKGGYHFGTWTGISGDTFHGRFSGANREVISEEWIDKNIQNNHGPLGAEYPDVEYLMEGDTPSFFHLIENGLNDPNHPGQGGWGGRYEHYTPHMRNFYFEPETRPFWTNAQDEVYSEIDERHHTRIQATIWRWREAYQNDFAARMDWCTQSYEEANHPPRVKTGLPDTLEVKAGEQVELKASGSTDPDGDKLSYHWIYYREAGNSVYGRNMKGENTSAVSFQAPDMGQFPQYMHFVLEITDNGAPPLTRYDRVVVKVK